MDSASHSVGVDETLSNGGMRALALKLSDLRASDVLFLRAPVAQLRQDGASTTVQLDPAQTAALWKAVQQGTATDFVRQNGRDAIGSITR